MPKKSAPKKFTKVAGPRPTPALRGTAEASSGVLARLVHHATGVQAKAVDRLLRPEGATRIQVGVLQHASKAGVAMGTLAERLDCHVSNLTGVVDRMQRQGLVRRQRAPRDRRRVLVRTTPEGERLCASLGLAVGDLQESLAGALSARENKQLCELLQKYIAGAEQSLDARSE